MHLSIIITTYKAHQELNACLKAYADQSVHGFEIIIAEDGEDPVTKAVVESWINCPFFTLKHVSQKDDGYRKAKILNQAIKASSGDYILFTDGDCIPSIHFVHDHLALQEHGCFVQGRRAFIKERAVPSVIHSKINILKLILTNNLQGIFKAFRLPFPIIRYDKGYLGTLGCSLGMFRKDLIAVNGLDEDFQSWGREDTELVARLLNYGLKRKWVHGRAILFHLNHPIYCRSQINENENRLQETVKTKKIRCKHGLESS